jgi:hypothetical protein
VILGDAEPEHPRQHGRASVGRELRAEGHRHLAEQHPVRTLADDAFVPVDDLGDLDVALDHDEQRPLVTLAGEVLTW